MATKKSTTKKTAKTKKAAKKTVAKTAKKAAKKAAKKVAAKPAKKSSVKAAKKPKKGKKESGVAPAPVAEAPPVDIAAIAYQIYLERIDKGIPGDEFSDWAAAEQRVHAA